MRNKLKIFVGIIALGLFTYACSDEFLDTPPQAALSGELLATNASGVNATLVAAYKGLSGWTGNWGVGPWGTGFDNYKLNWATDDAHKGSEPGDGDGWQTFELFQWNSQSEILRNKFASVYEGIARANSAINTAAAYEKNTGDKTLANTVKGEALCLRALLHMEGWKIWKNIPYYTETDIDFQKPNDQNVVPLIIKDFEEALKLLPDRRLTPARVDKNVALAFMGKLKLFNGDYAGALAHFNAVISSGQFRLMDCFYDNFSVAGNNNKESILSAQFVVNDGTGGGENGNYSERLAFPHGDSHWGCCGFNQPTYDLAFAYRVDANGLPIPIQPNTVLRKIEAGAADELDPRIDFTMGRTGVPYLDHGPHKDSWIRGAGFQGWYSPKKLSQKLSDTYSSAGWAPTQLSNMNLKIMRYADLLLMAAECEVEVGSLEKARDYVNQIRKRAGNCAQGPSTQVTVPINSPSITWAKYKVSTYNTPWANKDAARNAVRLERRLELALEGHRVFDLQRWKTLSTVVREYNAREKILVPKSAQSLMPDDKHLIFPLPNGEILKSQGKLKQNPGW